MSNLEDNAMSKLWDKLIELGVSNETLQIVTDINGYNEQTMCDVLYARTGYRSFDQFEGESEDDDEEFQNDDYDHAPECID